MKIRKHFLTFIYKFDLVDYCKIIPEAMNDDQQKTFLDDKK